MDKPAEARNEAGSGDEQFPRVTRERSSGAGSPEGSSNELKLPWSAGSRQRDGRKTEKRLAKKLGAKVHPASGALRIKNDASDETILYEIKDANKVHNIKAVELLKLWKEATMADKDAIYLVRFGNGITMYGVVERE